jgi:hypothetical protein
MDSCRSYRAASVSGCFSSRITHPAFVLPEFTPPQTDGSPFRSSAEMYDTLHAACSESDTATFHALGESEDGRPIAGAVLGNGEPREETPVVSLIAGNHADEPVGPLTLRRLVLDAARRPEAWAPLLERFRFVIVPHTNPDGEADNRAWMRDWPDAASYLRHRMREEPGRDLEFGFPAMRTENRLVSDFLKAQAPPGGYALHASLHGMALAEGAQLLIERRWGFRTEALREGFREAARAEGLAMHDHNRFGEKGFFYLGPGFNTTPEGAAMRAYFRAHGDESMAARFHDSSMEFVRALGEDPDPLCLVTELPLFVVPPAEDAPPGVPRRYLALRETLPELRLRLQRGEPITDELARYDVRPLPVATAVRLQRRALVLGLETVGA